MSNSSPDEESVINRLINCYVMLKKPNSDVPFECLCKFANSKKIVMSISMILKKARDPLVKSILSNLYQLYLIEKCETIGIEDDAFWVQQLLLLITETPPTGAAEELATFQIFVLSMIKLIRNVPETQLFNQIVKTASPYAPLAVVTLSHSSEKLGENVLKVVLAMLNENSAPSLAAASAFFKDKSRQKMDLESVKLVQNVIQNSLAGPNETRLLACELSSRFFESLEEKESVKVAQFLIPSFLLQLRELKEAVISSLLSVPVVPGTTILGSVLPQIAALFEEASPELLSGILQLVSKRKSENGLRNLVANLLESSDGYTCGVVLSGFLGYLDDDLTLTMKCFPVKPDVKQATAAVMTMSVLGEHQLFKKETFRAGFACLLSILTSPELLDDLILQFMIFKNAIGNITKQSGMFPEIVSSLVIEKLQLLKDDDVLCALSTIVSTVIESKELASVDMNEYAVTYVSLMLKYINDEQLRAVVMPFIVMISHSRPFDVDDMLCDVVEKTVPSSYVDAVRTEAILRSQSAPRAALIAVALPNSAPFLPTLCRVVRELVPEDPSLTKEFLLNAAKRALDSFIPHLMRFTEPVNVANTFWFVSVNKKHILHLREVLTCVKFICTTMSPSKAQISQLLEITDACIPSDQSKITLVMPEAQQTLVELAKTEELIWKGSFLKNIYSYQLFAPIFQFVLPHTPNDHALLSSACNSYTEWISKHPEDANDETCEQLFAIDASQTMLNTVLKSVIRTIDQSSDPRVMLNMCYQASELYKESNETQLVSELSEFVVSIAQYAMSRSHEIRCLTNDIYCSLFNLESLETSAEMSPVEIVDFAQALFHQVCVKFNTGYLQGLAIYLTNYRPFSYTQALMINSAVSCDSAALMRGDEPFLETFLEAGDLSVNESRVLLLNAAKMLAETDITVFMLELLSNKLTPFRIECIKAFIRDKDFRSLFLTSYCEQISRLAFPSEPKEQLRLLTTGFFQALSIIIDTDDMLSDTFGAVISCILVWLSLILTASGNIKLQKVTEDLISCFETIFSKLGKGTHEPIEFSLKSYQTLYQSLGTLVNALMLVSENLLVDFCKSCFVLLQSHVQTTVLTAALCLSRLLHKVSMFSSPKLEQQLRETVSLSFTLCCDENCRIMSAVMNDLFNRALIENFTENEIKNILKGVIRGAVFPGNDMKNECTAFLCKVVVIAPKSILQEESERLWMLLKDSDIAPLTLSAVTSLIELDKSLQHFTGKMRLESVILAAVGENPLVAKKALLLLETICDTHTLASIIQKLKKMIPDFSILCEKAVFQITKSNVSVAVMDLGVMLCAESGSTKAKDRLISIFLALIEDNDSVFRSQAAEFLSKLCN